MTAQILARCVHGLEWVVAEEISRRVPAVRRLDLARREVTFSLPAVDRALLDLRTVDDVFVSIGTIGGIGTTKASLPLLGGSLADLPVAGWVDAVRTIRPLADPPLFDVVASLEGHYTYNRFAVECAAGQALAPLLGGTFLERTRAGRPGRDPDLTVRLLLRGTTAIAALRLAGSPLHRRRYKQHTAAGTLHPPLAAALVRIAVPLAAGAPAAVPLAAGPPAVGTPDPLVLLDPFCGDGTIAIESMMEHRAASAAPRLVIGADLDPQRLGNARANAALAGVDPLLVRADAARLPLGAGSVSTLVTNPPWNLAVGASGELAGSLAPFWQRLPEALRGAGSRIVTVTDDAVDTLGMLREPGYAIGCHLRVRIAGRVSQVVLSAPPGVDAPLLDERLVTWRRRAISAGVVTDGGF